MPKLIKSRNCHKLFFSHVSFCQCFPSINLGCFSVELTSSFDWSRTKGLPWQCTKNLLEGFMTGAKLITFIFFLQLHMVVFPLACIENSVSYCTNTISNHAALFWGTSRHPYQTVVKSFLSSHLFLSCNVTVVAAWCITLCMVFSDYVKHLQWNKVFCCSSLPCAFCGLGWSQGQLNLQKALRKTKET